MKSIIRGDSSDDYVSNMFMKSLRKTIAFGVFTSFLVISAAFSKELHIVTIESAPFGFRDADDNPTGMMYEISNLIAIEAGFTFTNVIHPYQKTVLDVANGDADFVIRYGNPELNLVAIPVSQVLGLPTIVVSKPSLKFKSLSDLHGKTVGVMRGGKYDDDFDADAAIIKREVNNYPQTLKMLLAGRFDAGIGSSVGIYYNAYILGIKPEQLNSPLVLSTKYFELHFSKKNYDPEIIAKIKDAVDRLKKHNQIRQIVDRYMGTFHWDLPLN